MILVLGLLIWNRPYERKSGNVINIFIQVVRALSVVCILVFVEELGIAQTTQTVTGVVLIAVQSALTAILALLIAINAIIMCCKENPHRKRRKEAEKLNRDFDNLTPLDARNSLLMDPRKVPLTSAFEQEPKYPLVQQVSSDSFMNEPGNPYRGATPMRPITPASQVGRQNTMGSSSHRTERSLDREPLVAGAASIGNSPPRQPTIPRIPDQYGGGYTGYRGIAY
jgi:hypothetical protein